MLMLVIYGSTSQHCHRNQPLYLGYALQRYGLAPRYLLDDAGVSAKTP
jgi:hypothetical protein